MSHVSPWHIKLHCNCDLLRTLRISKQPNNGALYFTHQIENFLHHESLPIINIFNVCSIPCLAAHFLKLIGLKGWNRSNFFFSCVIDLHLIFIDFKFIFSCDFPQLWIHEFSCLEYWALMSLKSNRIFNQLLSNSCYCPESEIQIPQTEDLA